MSTTTATATVDRFLAAVTDGVGIPSDLYAPGATLDATVPGWRAHHAGPEAICAEYGRWFADPARFEELERLPLADGIGEVVTYVLAWTEDGGPMAARHGHLLRTGDDGRIVSDVAFCGGRWPAALLAQMAEAAL